MNKEFAQKVFDAAKGTGFSPAFVTAMTCIETGWGRNGNGNYNLFAELAPKEWTGKKNLVRVTQVVSGELDLQDGEYIQFQSKLKNGINKYIVYRYFKDYDSILDCLNEHLKVFDDFPVALKYKTDAHEFPKRISNEPMTGGGTKKYDSDPQYPVFIEETHNTLKKLGLDLGI